MRATTTFRAFRLVSIFLLTPLATCSDAGPTPVAVKVVFTSQPDAAVAGAVISPTIQIAAQEANGNTVTGASGVSVTLSITSGTGVAGATLGGTVTRTAVSGVATFDDITIDKAGSGYTLTATAVGLTIATSSTFIVAPGAASKLGVAVQPSAVAAGASIAPSVQFVIQDALGNTVTTSTSSVTVAITSGTGASGAVLGGTATVAAVAGVANFSNLSVDKAASGYTLTGSSTGLTSAATASFAVSPGAAAKLSVSVQPANATAGVALAPSVQITVLDALNNTVTSATTSITVAVTGGTGAAGATLSGTKTVSATSGVAAFSTLSLDKAASGYSITATASGLTSATSSTFTISPASATKLAVTVQPSNSTGGSAISPAIQVSVQDAFGNTATSATNSVTVAITSGTGTGGATLGGTKTVAAASGIATFSTLNVDKVGSGYTLDVTASGLTSTVTSSFNVALGPPAKLVFNVNATSAVSNVAISPSIEVGVLDAGGNATTTATNSITLSIGTDPSVGATLSGTKTVAAVSGVATFGGLSINRAGTGYTLVAAATGLTSGTGTAFNITAGAAAQLIRVSSTHGQTAVAGSAVALPLAVNVYDASSNPVAGVSVTFAVTAGGGNITGSPAISNASGVATAGTWTLGGTVGQNDVTASLTASPGVTVIFQATGTGGPATQVSVSASTNNQTANAGDVVPNSPRVLVKDANGNPAPGATVTFHVTGGGGTISDSVGTSGAGGFVDVGSWQLGVAVGVNTLSATSPGMTGSPLTFTATGVVGPGHEIFINAGNNQTATVSTAVATPVSVVVKDVNGNPVGAGQTIEWQVLTGSGTPSAATSLTNASGVASIGWTLGATPGSNTLQATFVRQPSGFQVNVTFTATGQ